MKLNQLSTIFLCQGQYACRRSFILFPQATCLRNEVCRVIFFILEGVWFMRCSNPWLPVKCDVEQCGSACFPYGNVDKSVLKDILSVVLYSKSCFERCENPHSDILLSLNPSVQKGSFFHSLQQTVIFKSHFVDELLSNRAPYTDPHLWMCTTFANALLCLLKCILLCSGGLVLLFYCCCISGVCLWSAMSESWLVFLLLDGWVTEQHGCKYFCVNF